MIQYLRVLLGCNHCPDGLSITISSAYPLKPRRAIKFDKSTIIEKIQTPKKFENSFNLLDKDLKKLTQKAISNLLNGNFSGIEPKKIKLSNQITFYRMRINNKYRIHFQGSLEAPIFINIGAHKLYEFGYVID